MCPKSELQIVLVILYVRNNTADFICGYDQQFFDQLTCLAPNYIQAHGSLELALLSVMQFVGITE